VLMPSLVQLALLLTLGGTGTLLRSRSRDGHAASGSEARAAATAAEAVMLMMLIWVTFQAYTAVALVRMWSVERQGLGTGYTAFELVSLGLTTVVGIRAHKQLGRPLPLPYVPAHWRLGQLYCNPDHPALFVPTRDGSRWTLNFGRPAAAALLAGILAAGIALPIAILVLALRS
jgi:uncharacterized membrane protein